MKRLSLACLLLSSAACTLASSSYSESRMNDLASALTKLSSAVDGAVRYQLSPPPSQLLDDEQFLKLATVRNPSVLEPFRKANVKLRVKRLESETIILVCRPDANIALLEDATCSAPMDKHRWKDQPQTTCDFTLNLAEVCK